jgi:ABC-type transporter Mla subunit MlaD
MRRSRRDMADDIPQLRKEIEELRARLDKQERKLASAFALIDRVDALMAQVYALLARIEAAVGAGGAAGVGEQFNKFRSLLATLEEVVAQKGSQSEEIKRLLSELHQLTAKAHENLGGKKS